MKNKKRLREYRRIAITLLTVTANICSLLKQKSCEDSKEKRL